MKKNVFIALLACATLAFVGCDNGAGNEQGANGGSGAAVTGVTVSPATLNLTLDETYRLACTFTPSGATGTVTWKSSNEDVVTVTSKGVVEAVGYGTANVTATCGEYTGVCAVNVTTYYETLQFNNALLNTLDTLKYGGEPEEIEASDGTKYKAYLAEAEMLVFSDGFYVNNSGQFDGTEQGTLITVKAPMYYATAYLNNSEKGTVFSIGNWYVAAVDPDSLYTKVGQPTTFLETEYKQFMAAAVQAYNAGDDATFGAALGYAGKCFDGTMIETLEYHSTSEGYPSNGYYSPNIPAGLIEKGQFTFTGKEGASAYMYGLDYSYFEFKPLDDINYYWGCNWIFAEDGSISWGDTDIKWLDKIVCEYGEKPAAEAQRKLEPLNIPVMSIDYPEVAERIANQLKQYNTLVVKK